MDNTNYNWNKFIIENNRLFLQSWEWGEFQKSLGRKIWRLGDGENWTALIIRYDLPMGKNYLYCPGGPTTVSRIKDNVSGILEKFLNETKNIAKKERSIFLKAEPFWPIPEVRSEELSKHGFAKVGGGQRILKTLVLDLKKPEDELLKEMKQKTRYNIRLAEKHGVIIRISDNLEKDFEYFWDLAQETRQRDGFRLHPKEYYKKQLLINGSLEMKLFLAEYQKKIVAANIVAIFGGQTAYLHGASSNESRNIMAPYLLQWEQIKEAKRRGCETYDFWGIDEKMWPGVTKFKKGFGGKEVGYIGVFDYVLNKTWYGLYKLAKRIY